MCVNRSRILELYRLLLNRDANKVELRFWLEKLEAGCDIEELRQDLLSSYEFQAELRGLWRKKFGRNPSENEVLRVRSAMALGGGILSALPEGQKIGNLASQRG